MTRRLQGMLLLFVAVLGTPTASLVAWLRARGELRVTLAAAFAVAGASLVAHAIHRRLPLWRGLLATALFASCVYGAGIGIHGLSAIRHRPEDLTHLALFAAIGWMATAALEERPWSFAARAAFALALTVAMGTAHESLQIFQPDRIFDPRDIASDALGGALGIVLRALLPGPRTAGGAVSAGAAPG